ncbi:TetR/AcrR family transcriptional regulator [Muricoccus vinaceus]|uniref:TetR/AcrR family transcriptional regulator n=1 Tax=Muricoccus vinaceus TaxID=424704 RepID=A0ABV6IVD4_9PROT
MPANKSPPSISPRGDATRQRVLEAAERLLREGSAEFSMRDLAAAAGVSFATPFNQFGSKAAIMRALSAQRIEAMAARFSATAPPGDAAARVLAAVSVAAAVMLEEPVVSRAVMGSLGAPGPEPGQVSGQSRALWALALGAGDGLTPNLADLALRTLPDGLAFAFRGVLSFWTAGEIGDAALAPRARATAATVLLGFVEEARRDGLIRLLPA